MVLIEIIWKKYKMRVQAHLICAFFVRGCKEYANKALSQNPAIAILFERVYKSMPKRALGAGFDRNTWEETAGCPES